MYETGNQKNRDKKRVVLRNPRRQRGRDEARSVASTETKAQGERSAPRGTAVFIVDSFVLISLIFIVRMIALSINLQRDRIQAHF